MTIVNGNHILNYKSSMRNQITNLLLHIICEILQQKWNMDSNRYAADPKQRVIDAFNCIGVVELQNIYKNIIKIVC